MTWASKSIEPELSDADFHRISRYVHDLAGIVLPDNKRPLVHSRIMRRLRALGLHSFSSYIKVLENDAGGLEQQELISAVTTNVTSFFRESHHFDYLTQRILPPLLARAKAGGRVRIWSAGCSTGEEPYSVSATVLSMMPDANNYDLKVLATDIDHDVLRRAKVGCYSADVAKTVPTYISRSMFVSAEGVEMVKVMDDVRKLVTFNALNLNTDWPVRSKFDVIMCRNVVIYFDRQMQERIWKEFSKNMNSGGYLMVGHSERITGSALSYFRSDGITTYNHI